MTHYPFPTYQEETRYLWQYHCEGGDEGSRCDYKWVEQAVVKKSNYFLAGRPIATRITGDPVSGNNGLFYFLTDHLGSTTILITAAGAVVAGTAAYYQPYGNYRTTPTTTLTERGYTGHHENRDIGLTYMNARYYIPGLGRFLTADTLIPDPTNPQSHNRYSYVRGNPLVLVDPTGHYECHTDNNICVDATTPPPPSRTPPVSIWTRSLIDEPDWVQYYGHTKFAEGYGYSTNSGQHPGLDYGKSGQSFGGTWNGETRQWDFDGTYGTLERPLIPVYAGCYCNVSSTSTGSPYAPGRVNLTHESYSDFLLIYGHLQDIQVTSGSVTPDTIIGYLDTSERHLHLEIRRISDNHFVNPFPYLSAELQTDMLSFRGVDRSTTYQPGYPAHPAYQRSGYYLR